MIQPPYLEAQKKVNQQIIPTFVKGGYLRNYNSATMRADIELFGSSATYLKDVPVNKCLNALGDSLSSTLLNGNNGAKVLVLTYDENNPNANVVVAIY